MTRVLICDERRGARDALTRLAKSVPAVEAIDSVACGDDLLQEYRRRPADLVLIGTQRALSSGFESARRLLAFDPAATITVFGSPDDAVGIAAALACGVRSYLRWDTTCPVLLSTLAGILANSRILPSAARRSSPGLSERELQVLHGMSCGRSNHEIGAQMHLSEDTVKTHARRLFRKLQATDRAQAVAIGFRQGLVA